MTAFVFGTDIIQIFSLDFQNFFFEKWNLAVKFNCQEASYFVLH